MFKKIQWMKHVFIFLAPNNSRKDRIKIQVIALKLFVEFTLNFFTYWMRIMSVSLSCMKNKEKLYIPVFEVTYF